MKRKSAPKAGTAELQRVMPPLSFCCLCIERGEVLAPEAWLAGRRKKRGSCYKVAMKYYDLNDSARQRSTKKNQLANKNSSQFAKCFHTDPPGHLRGDGQSARLPGSQLFE